MSCQKQKGPTHTKETLVLADVGDAVASRVVTVSGVAGMMRPTELRVCLCSHLLLCKINLLPPINITCRSFSKKNSVSMYSKRAKFM